MPPWVGPLLRVGGTAALMTFALRTVEWQQLFSLFRTIDWRWWLTALGVAMFVQTIAALRWAALARPIGFPLPTSVFIRRFFEGAFFSLCLPSSIGGDVIKAYRLSDSTSGRLLAGCTVLADRLAGLTALGVLAGTALAAMEWSLPWFQTLLVGAGLLLAAWLPMRLGIASLNRLAGVFPEGHPAKRFIAQLLPYQEQPELLTHAFLWSLLVQVGSTLTVVLVGKSLGVTLPLVTWFAVVPLVALAMVLPISVSGVGIREGGLAFLLAPHGVAAEKAVAIGLLWFLTTICCGLVGGVLFLLDRNPHSTTLPTSTSSR
ncbi:MAG: lysylphosphatidylglycerol synthase transmembrane domain-containing protein [Planctomycetota bacterium]